MTTVAKLERVSSSARVTRVYREQEGTVDFFMVLGLREGRLRCHVELVVIHSKPTGLGRS